MLRRISESLRRHQRDGFAESLRRICAIVCARRSLRAFCTAAISRCRCWVIGCGCRRWIDTKTFRAAQKIANPLERDWQFKQALGFSETVLHASSALLRLNRRSQMILHQRAFDFPDGIRDGLEVVVEDGKIAEFAKRNLRKRSILGGIISRPDSSICTCTARSDATRWRHRRKRFTAICDYPCQRRNNLAAAYDGHGANG